MSRLSASKEHLDSVQASSMKPKGTVQDDLDLFAISKYSRRVRAYAQQLLRGLAGHFGIPIKAAIVRSTWRDRNDRWKVWFLGCSDKSSVKDHIMRLYEFADLKDYILPEINATDLLKQIKSVCNDDTNNDVVHRLRKNTEITKLNAADTP